MSMQFILKVQMKRELLAIFMAAVISISPAHAEEEPTGPLGWGPPTINSDMETDRPDFTEGVTPIAPGHLQLESGYTYTRDSEPGVLLEEHTVPEFLLRIGLIEDLELRLGWAGYISSEGLGEDGEKSRVEGINDFSLGFKHGMYREDGWLPNLSLIGEISLPTGSREVTSDEVEPGVKFLWSYEFDDFGLTGNLNFSGPIGEDGRYFETAASAAAGFDFSESYGAYLEYFGIFPADSVPETDEHYASAGLTWAVTHDFQLDARVGWGINDAAADFFTGVGFAIRH